MANLRQTRQSLDAGTQSMQGLGLLPKSMSGAIVFSMLLLGIVSADTIELKSGVKVQGRVIRGELSSTPSKIEIQLEDGVTVEWDSSQILRVVPLREVEQSYVKNIEKFSDDAAGNEKLIDLCNSNDLRALTLAHRERLLEHNPDHGQSRTAMRYIKSPRDGWVLEEKYWAALGMKRDAKHKWRFPEEIAIAEKKQKQKEAEAQAGKQLIQWINDIKNQTKRAEVALAQIRDLKDANFVPRIQEILLTEKFPVSTDLRGQFIDALARIGNRPCIYILCDVYLTETDRTLQDRALDGVVGLKSPIATAYFISKLANRDPFNDNVQTINRAGSALGAIGDSRAIPPLIESLVTKHNTVRAPGAQTNAAMNKDNSNMSFNYGDDKPKVEQTVSNNRDVLSGLIQLVPDENHHFDQQAWREWYAAQRAATNVGLRRDQ